MRAHILMAQTRDLAARTLAQFERSITRLPLVTFMLTLAVAEMFWLPSDGYVARPRPQDNIRSRRPLQALVSLLPAQRPPRLSLNLDGGAQVRRWSSSCPRSPKRSHALSRPGGR